MLRCLQVCFAAAPTICNRTAAAFDVLPAPLTATLLPGGNVVAGSQPVTLQCAGADPENDFANAFEYEWECVGPLGDECRDRYYRAVQFEPSNGTQAR